MHAQPDRLRRKLPCGLSSNIDAAIIIHRFRLFRKSAAAALVNQLHRSLPPSPQARIA